MKHSNDYNIVQATIDDIESIIPLFDAYRVYYKQPSDYEAARAYLLNKFTQLASVIFLAKDIYEKTIGFTQLYPSFSSVSLKKLWILNDLYVDENYRGKGIGTALLNKAKAFSIKTNARGIILETNLDNHGARKLYESHGYKTDGNQVIHYYLNV